MKKTRLFYGGVSCALLLFEIGIAIFTHDNFIRSYVGDVLVTLLLCSFWRIFFPKGIKALPLYVFFFALVVEIGQYFDVVALLGIQNRFISILLGRTFSVLDIVCYAGGCLLAFLLDYRIKSK